MSSALRKRAVKKELISCVKIIVLMIVAFSTASSSFATSKALSQIVTPDLQGEGDLPLSLQIQDKRIANPYQLQAELDLTKWGGISRIPTGRVDPRARDRITEERTLSSFR